MEKIVRHFGDDSVRMIRINGQFMFAAYDVANALKLTDPKRAINMIAIMEKQDHKMQLVEWEHEKIFVADQKFMIKLALRAEYSRQIEFITYLIRVIREETIKALRSQFDDIYDKGVTRNHFATTQIAKAYEMSAAKLNKILESRMIQYKVNDQWVLMAPYQDQGYTVSIPYKKSNDETVLHTYWTEKGMKFVSDELNKAGYYRSDQLKFDMSV